MDFDFLIKNAKILDGTGSPWFRGDIAVKDGRIAGVGKVSGESTEIINVSGLAVSPGFIDIHSHSDFSLIVNPEADSFIRQGITSVLNGHCGFSAMPFNELGRDIMNEIRGFEGDWLTTREYFNVVEAKGVALNIGTLTGLGNLLVSVMGMDAFDRSPSQDEVEEMKMLLRTSLDEGSYGLSSGLEYDPQTLTPTETLIDLCNTVASCGGLYATHVRNRDIKVVEAAKEAIRIGEESGVRVEGVHWGARFPSDGKTKHIVDLCDEARSRGLDIAFDQIPWTIEDGYGWCGCTLIGPIIIGSKFLKKGGKFTYEMLTNPEVKEYLRGDLINRQYGPILAGVRGPLDSWDRFMVAHTENSPEYNGLNLREIGVRMNLDPFDALFELLVNEGEGFLNAWGAIAITSQWDTDFSLLHQHCSVAIDATNDSPTGSLSTEPVGETTTRAYGQFPYFFQKWVREERLLELEDAVRKCTGLPAQRMGLMDRGLIRPEMWADIIIWDPDEIRNNATFMTPRVYPNGIHRVYVNGVLVVEDNKHTGVLPGKTLRF
ncbi:MAG: amidohydrolase family protein [Candidatus Bathyarchaeota archaeon]|nr:amidohydrolase family protein [Candidatus Bathyarchaeota archaeon]